ncbi:hypothetical protein S40285_10601 [Stachybotrys chlorohalonatus IBT 40285]|uniref:Apple domain-containing protein n=1 Tax=Stachybotrys chlorohalonatus (strain IBT 40285) TaxID=1283841 RepID=A0A084Q916_STAC4|nr:hypothetical protein S40285_10601 [Stachybotrys chlorohalonata IBT 40285]
MPAYPYSDLEVVPAKAIDSAPEVVPGNAPEVVLGSGAHEGIWYHKQDTPGDAAPAQRRICGVRARTFWIILGVAVTLVIAAIAGGVAAALTSRSSTSDGSVNQDISTSSSASLSPSSTESSASPPPSSEPPTTSTVSISTTTVVLPTTTLLRDCPSSNGTIYEADYDSEEEPLMFRKFCTAGFRHVRNGIDVINEPTQSLNDCINMCVDYNDRNSTAIAAGNNQTCNAVCWRSNEQLGNVNQIPGQCFGFTTLNNSAGFQVTDEVLCDSAGWINQRDL